MWKFNSIKNIRRYWNSYHSHVSNTHGLNNKSYINAGKYTTVKSSTRKAVQLYKVSILLPTYITGQKFGIELGKKSTGPTRNDPSGFLKGGSSASWLVLVAVFTARGCVLTLCFHHVISTFMNLPNRTRRVQIFLADFFSFSIFVYAKGEWEEKPKRKMVYSLFSMRKNLILILDIYFMLAR